VAGEKTEEENTMPWIRLGVPLRRQLPTANRQLVRSPGMSIAALASMLRRVLALVGIVVVVALALTLFVRVWVHHTQAAPYVDDDRAIVALDAKFAGGRS
jgi:hypothetical protein